MYCIFQKARRKDFECFHHKEMTPVQLIYANKNILKRNDKLLRKICLN
jgi:hypothetical protein